MQQAEKRRCINCVFCEMGIENKQGEGICYFNPPTPVLIGGELKGVRVTVDLYKEWCDKHTTFEEYSITKIKDFEIKYEKD